MLKPLPTQKLRTHSQLTRVLTLSMNNHKVINVNAANALLQTQYAKRFLVLAMQTYFECHRI